MQIHTTSKGQSLIEILLAVAVFTLGVVTIGFLVLESLASMRFAQDSLSARLLAQEGLEGVRAIRNDSFDRLQEGMYGLSRSDTGFELSEDPDEMGKFTRSVTLTQTEDGVFEVNASVQWDDSVISLTTVLSNWRQNAGEAKDISFDLNNAVLTSSSTHLYGVALINTGLELSTITDMGFQYEDLTGIARVSVRGEDVFVASTSSAPVSGDLIDVEDHELPAASGYHLLDVYLTEPATFSEVVITLQFSDGSVKHARVTL